MGSQPKANTVAGGIVRGFTTVLLIGIVALAGAVAVVPAVTGGKALAVLSGSMEPTLHTGDLIVVTGVKNPLDLKINDIITYLPDAASDQMVTHRIIAKGFEESEVRFTTQGDANDAADPPVYGKQVRGRLLFRIPWLGHVTTWAAVHAPWAVVALASALILGGLWAAFGPRRRRRDDDQPPASNESSGRHVKGPVTAAAILGVLMVAGGPGAPDANAADTPRPGALTMTWDHNVLNLSWQGGKYFETVLSNDTFHHMPVAVPGDFVYRTLNLTNNTPCPAALTVKVINVETVEQPDTVNHENGAFADISSLVWDVGGTQGQDVFSSIEATGGRTLGVIPVVAYGTEQIKIAYTFDSNSTTGKNLGFPSQELRYDVEIVLRGDTCAADQPPNTPTSSVSIPPTSSTTPPPTITLPPGSTPPGDGLEYTGSNAAFATISAGFLIAAGATIVAGRRRDRKMRTPL
ncbi:MAG: signal peptidase I [Bifidobacteriaceae bacterium]|jgi:signal peptidase|nr:signal peptidase I [Bifidobacteriaceae bacterium]